MVAMYTVIIPYKKPYTDVRYEIEASSISDARAKGLTKAFYDNGSLPHFKLRITKQVGNKMIEVPEFLLEMSKQLNTQDNRITAEPLYQVRHKAYLVTEEGYNDHHFELYDNDVCETMFSSLESDEEPFREHLIDHCFEWCKKWACCLEELDNADDEAITERFHELYEISCDEFPSCINKVHQQEIEKVVKSCLTQADAEWFIKRKQHDYPKLYIYVESMVYCPQMIELRDWIKNLTSSKG